MARTKKFLYNSCMTLIYQVIVMISGFIIPRIMLVYYGSEINGLVSSIRQIISYFSLVEAGLAGSAIFALYKPLAYQDHQAINGIVAAAKKFYGQASVFFSSLVIILAFLYPFFIPVKSLSPLLVGILIVVLGAKGILEMYTISKYRVLLTADQKSYILSFASIIYVIFNTILIHIFSELKVNIVIIYVLALLPLLFRSLILFLYVKVKYPFLNFNVTPNTLSLKNRWDVFFLQLLGLAQNGAPIIIATIFLSLKDVSIYSIFNMINVGIVGIIGIFSHNTSAAFGEIIAKNETAILQKSYQVFEFSYYALITIIFSVAMILIMPFIFFYTRNVLDANYNQPIIGFLFILNSYLSCLKTPQGMLVIAAGLYKETRYRSLTQALIIIVCGSIFVNFWGLKGILIACCLSNLYRIIDLLFYIPKMVTKLPFKSSLLCMLWSIVTISTLIIYEHYFISFKIESLKGFIFTGINLLSISSIFVLCLSIIFYREQLIIGFKKIIRIKKGA